MDFDEAWSFLDQLQFFKIKLGLDSMARFLDGVEHPQRDLKFIHVAGTNGKGSVSVTLLALLKEAGYKVGLYTSPHLSSVRERFRINDGFISRDDFARIATQIRDSLNGRQITYFEFTTALALLWFAREKVDFAILEVGLGGRLDATNVITPLVSVITNVSMDHELHLGNTLSEVATEKAGIIKNSVPVVSGVAADESLEVVNRTCAEKKAPFFLLGRDFHVALHDDGSFDYQGLAGKKFCNVSLRMKGAYQIDNTAIALATLDCLEEYGVSVDEKSVRSALTHVFWPGRLEYFCLDKKTGRPASCPDGVTPEDNESDVLRYLLDGAHNPAGIECLAQSLETHFTFNRLICVWASMADKDISKTLNVLAPYCDMIFFTRPEEERSATTDALSSILSAEHRHKARSTLSVSDALCLARSEAESGDLICVAGSLYLIGAARRLLLGDIVL
ncbi:MAG: bifunctional folylpolyglutamate synthase/dihydrofolate synthase [Desulfobulbaceae bacterium]|nr:bifunctional folylpolyglutamate synthase/dihydrofolate synthase [Desulfobulbaceae bacterium]